MAKGKAADLAAWIEREQPSRIAEAEFAALRAALAPVSESYLRKLVRNSGVPLGPLIEGVRQENFEALERSLSALLDEYEQGDAARRAAVRRLVIAAKDHAHFAARRLAASDEARRAEKDEMMLWMLTWLENPPLFRDWARLRRRAR
jgi:hypothetical protein